MTTTNYISPDEIEFYADHSDETLREIVARKTAESFQSEAMFPGNAMAPEMLAIANAARWQLALRQMKAAN